MPAATKPVTSVEGGGAGSRQPYGQSENKYHHSSLPQPAPPRSAACRWHPAAANCSDRCVALSRPRALSLSRTPLSPPAPPWTHDPLREPIQSSQLSAFDTTRHAALHALATLQRHPLFLPRRAAPPAVEARRSRRLAPLVHLQPHARRLVRLPAGRRCGPASRHRQRHAWVWRHPCRLSALNLALRRSARSRASHQPLHHHPAAAPANRSRGRRVPVARCRRHAQQGQCQGLAGPPAGHERRAQLQLRPHHRGRRRLGRQGAPAGRPGGRGGQEPHRPVDRAERVAVGRGLGRVVAGALWREASVRGRAWRTRGGRGAAASRRRRRQQRRVERGRGNAPGKPRSQGQGPRADDEARKRSPRRRRLHHHVRPHAPSHHRLVRPAHVGRHRGHAVGAARRRAHLHVRVRGDGGVDRAHAGHEARPRAGVRPVDAHALPQPRAALLLGQPGDVPPPRGGRPAVQPRQRGHARHRRRGQELHREHHVQRALQLEQARRPSGELPR